MKKTYFFSHCHFFSYLLNRDVLQSQVYIDRPAGSLNCNHYVGKVTPQGLAKFTSGHYPKGMTLCCNKVTEIKAKLVRKHYRDVKSLLCHVKSFHCYGLFLLDSGNI